MGVKWHVIAGARSWLGRSSQRPSACSHESGGGIQDGGHRSSGCSGKEASGERATDGLREYVATRRNLCLGTR